MKSPEYIRNLEHWDCVIEDIDESGRFLVRACAAAVSSFDEEFAFKFDELGDSPPLGVGSDFHWHVDELFYSDGSTETVTNFCFPPIRTLTPEQLEQSRIASEEFARRAVEALAPPIE